MPAGSRQPAPSEARISLSGATGKGRQKGRGKNKAGKVDVTAKANGKAGSAAGTPKIKRKATFEDDELTETPTKRRVVAGAPCTCEVCKASSEDFMIM